MNFVFISPHFPKTYYQFCQELKNNGVNVLGIASDWYGSLTDEVKNSLNIIPVKTIDEVIKNALN